MSNQASTDNIVEISSNLQLSEIRDLTQEMRLLRSFLSSFLVKDEEGEYKPEFVKKILKAVQEKPIGIFKDKKSFLKENFFRTPAL